MLPYYKQETDFYCGPAVVQMLFAGRGVMMTQTQLAEALGTAAGAGTSLEAIVHILSLHGFETKHKNGASLADIAEALGAGKSALVGYTETENQEPHYALVAPLGAQAPTRPHNVRGCGGGAARAGASNGSALYAQKRRWPRSLNVGNTHRRQLHVGALRPGAS